MSGLSRPIEGMTGALGFANLRTEVSFSVQKTVYAQLSALTFFQFIVIGAYSPVIGTYLKDTLHFTGTQVGLTLTVFQAASMAAPLVAAFIVDRLVSGRALYAVLHLIGAGLSVALVHQREFLPFLGLFGVYAFFLGPTGGLVNALTFARMPDGRGQYGAVRLWGTLGWIASAVILALVWLAPGSAMAWMFYLSALGSLVAAAGTLILPHAARVRPEGPFRLIPREAFRVFLQPGILKIGAVYFVCGILDRFYFIATAPYLKQLGFSDSQLMPAMTLGQVTEVFLLLLTGTALKKWGLRNTLLVGLGFQFVRFSVMALNPGPLWLLAALSLNGFVFAFFYAVVTIYVDGHTVPVTRGGVHQLMSLIFAGTSSVVGSLAAGFAFDWFSASGRVDYGAFWTLPLVLSLVALGLVFFLFSPREKASE